MWERGYSKKEIGEREKHEVVSKIPSYQVILLKLIDDGVEVVEQQVDRTHVVDKNIASSSPQILG